MSDIKFRSKLKINTLRVKSPFLLLLLLCLVPIKNAHAYLDPGTGSYIIQILIGAGLGAGYVLKVYGSRIIRFFSGLRKKKENQEKSKGNELKKSK